MEERSSIISQGDYTMNPEIVNLYIERLLREIEELNKNRLLVETQLRFTESLNVSFSEKIKSLESQLEKQNTKKTSN